MTDAAQDDRSYLDPAVLAAIASLELRARTVVEGYRAGIHRSPHPGISVEFAQHRAYTQSDDVRHVDWKVFGRTDKLYVKRHEQETDLRCILAVDASASMGYTPRVSDRGRCTKYVYATTLAACLAYLALQQRDSVGLGVFDERIRAWVRPSSQPATLRAILENLHGAVGPGKTSLGTVLRDLAHRLDRRSLVIVISDLLDDPDTVRRGLEHLRSRGHDLIVLQVLDVDEWTFPFDGPTRFDGLESSGRLCVDPVTLRESYRAEIRKFTSTLARACRANRIDYETLTTDVPLDVGLTRYLAKRSACRRSLQLRIES